MLNIKVKDNDKAEFIGQIIDIFEDFLEEKNISIDNPDRDEQDPEFGAIIYGMDYGELQEEIDTLLENWSR